MDANKRCSYEELRAGADEGLISGRGRQTRVDAWFYKKVRSVKTAGRLRELSEVAPRCASLPSSRVIPPCQQVQNRPPKKRHADCCGCR